MIYQGPRCNVVVLSPEEIFVIVPHRICDLPNPELHRGFLAVSLRRFWEKVNRSRFCKEVEGFIA